MISKEFLKIIDQIDDRIKEKNKNNNITKKESVFGRAVKLSEEVGELSGEVLANFGHQRDIKLKNKDENDLKYEFADVILTTLILAKSMDIDINEALELKLKKIEDRGGL